MREQHAVAADQPGPLTDADGIPHPKVEHGHVRYLATVFGTVTVTRCAHRAEGARNRYPADAALNLPGRRHSHGLQRYAAIEATRGSYRAATEAITRACGNVVGKRQVEQVTRRRRRHRRLLRGQRADARHRRSTLPVLSVDGKGVAMRPEALRAETRKAAAAKPTGTYQTRLASGEKPARKRMATLGAVYDADPVPRRPTTSSPRPSASTPLLPVPVPLVTTALGGAAPARSRSPSG